MKRTSVWDTFHEGIATSPPLSFAPILSQTPYLADQDRGAFTELNFSLGFVRHNVK